MKEGAVEWSVRSFENISKFKYNEFNKYNEFHIKSSFNKSNYSKTTRAPVASSSFR